MQLTLFAGGDRPLLPANGICCGGGGKWGLSIREARLKIRHGCIGNSNIFFRLLFAHLCGVHDIRGFSLQGRGG